MTDDARSDLDGAVNQPLLLTFQPHLHRRFGPAFAKPCRRQNTIICTRETCQIANQCQAGRKAESP